MNILQNILYDTLYHSIPIILCAIGGSFAYKANVLNIALEGMMLNGAFLSTLFVLLIGNVYLSVFITVIGTLLLGLVFSLLGITYKGNVIIVGLGINLTVSAIAEYILQTLNVSTINLNVIDVVDLKIRIPFVEEIPILGSMISGHPLIVYGALVMTLLLWVIMYHTKFGIHIRSLGENEETAKSLGIKINVYKYLAVLLSAFTSALAGINLSLERLALFTNNMTAGRGFVAVAAIYCGKGNPITSSIICKYIWIS